MNEDAYYPPLTRVTNFAAGVLPQPLNHGEVLETAQRVRLTFIALLKGVIAGI